ncbi:ABC-type nitrate/sulfonate/bicarbonate transport system, periplasmic component [Roseovarius mucosus DSM 17069]|uniref:ABC-type nitrate/sulfonate/bicarbonate transport system, periplasmic component n=1 Tax=Roseovarius mucosus DSM 17069 TaxID=1288298 RepID=A0A0A0HHN7_9RHOB|nr:CmpA/NrtA family ABC transporter substrate-binding protein [Roseovarius mucosus]KGM86456.1 ABC-type nitrate/sulfonate/bicarbonate transport system, periplasmic component [Roseovarius mucosus DSM 17069]
MTRVTVPVAYMPLVDAAPLIVAQEMGFAHAEGIALDLIAAPSWSSVRDMLAFGRVDAAHMLSPVPVAMAMGLGGVATAMSALSVLSVNGNVIGVGKPLEDRLRSIGFEFDFADPAKAARALAEVRQGPITFGVPFPFSMHVELLRYWSAATDLGADGIVIRTVPPPLMANALAAGDIDAFCVGEPWGSVAVEQGAGALLLPGVAIWSFAPEKVLAVRTEWAETEPDLTGRLMRAVWRAGRWLADPDARLTAATLLSRKSYLDLSPELIDRALSGHLVVSDRGEQRRVDGFLMFHHGAANFPWRSQAKWIGQHLAQYHGTRTKADIDVIAKVYRADLYRMHMGMTGSDMPGASEKVEGAILHATPVASAGGTLTLLPNRFFDAQVFDFHLD